MDKKTHTKIVKQLGSLYGIVLFCFSLLLLRLLQLQVIEGHSWKAKAESTRQEDWITPAPRGDIYDRNHRLLVTSKPSFTLYFTPLGKSSQEYHEIARSISIYTGQNLSLIEKKMDVSIPYHLPISEPRCLLQGMSIKEVALISEHGADLPGIRILTEPKRMYLEDSFACHIIGYLNSIPKVETKKFIELGYKPDARVGVSGAEKSYESWLNGQNGIIRTQVNHLNLPIHTQIVSEPVKGNNLILTIDHDLQRTSEEALAEQIEKINSNPKLKHVKNAMAVAMNPETGEVLAMASYPSFNPNWWVGGIDETRYQIDFAPAEMNRVLQEPIAPGSTIKPATVLLGLQKGVITGNTQFFDSGRLQVGWLKGKPYYLNCWDHEGHGFINARQALAMSCNVYMYNLSLLLGGWSNYLLNPNDWVNYRLPKTANTFDSYYKQFGLGLSTEIDLDEEKGFMGQAKFLADLPFIAIGQHESYTAMELLQYISVLSNGGKRMRPYIMKEITSVNGKVLLANTPKILDRIHIPEEHLRIVRKGMEDVISAPYGTAYSSFRGATYVAAGKTGTAETGVGEDNALFVGYAPAAEPKIAITVIVPGGGHGADSSVPIARKIFDSYFTITQKTEGKKG